MSQLNDIVTAICQLDNKPDNIKKLQKQLENAIKSIKKNVNHVDEVISVLDPRRNTLGYIYFLQAKLQGSEIKNHHEFLEQARRLLLGGEVEQIAYAPAYFANICRAFTTSVLYTEKYTRGVHPLFVAIQKVQGLFARLQDENEIKTKQQGATPNLLTSVHTNFALVCLKARCYNYALQVLDTPLYEIRPKENGIEPQDYLSYFYYGGLIYLGLKKFSNAIEFFQLALTMPTRILSVIQVESYKKYILACLISQGEFVSLPNKLTSATVLRNVERLTQPYVELYRAFKKGVEPTQKVVQENIELFKKDKNYGLVKQSVEALIRRNIQRLTNTYITLSLEDIAQQVHLKSPKEAEKYVINMIEDGMIFATINQRDGMVSFLDNPEDYDTSQQVEILDAKIQQVIQLSEKLKNVDRNLSSNIRYIVRTTPQLLQGMSGGGIAGGPSGMMPLGVMGIPGIGPMHHPSLMTPGPTMEEMQMNIALEESLHHHP